MRLDFRQKRPWASGLIREEGELRFTIKPLTVSETPAVLDLNSRCFADHESYSREVYQHLLTSPEILGYHAVLANGISAGFLFMKVSPEGIGHVTTVAIAPEYRRKGLARQLISHGEKALRNRGISTVRLEVRVSNSIARRLYERLGFTTVQRLVDYYRDQEDAFLMVKAI